MRRGSENKASGHVHIPQVSFRVMNDATAQRKISVHDIQAKNFGYVTTEDFSVPEHYIRYIEPIESELATQVEYDMDEQDQEWLDTINAERKKEQLDPVTYEFFEVIMDRLEKEWFDLMKRVPKQETALPSEDSTCAICDDGEGENSNAIVFCDGCNLAVHQDCYGVPYIPEGQWLCRKCTVSPENTVSCILCPNEGGAFKQTSEGTWAHLLCAIWVPEVTVGNQVFMEPIEHVDKIPKSRWRLTCSLCPARTGACIQCDNRSCFIAFHVTCARKHGHLMPMKTLPDPDHDEAPQDIPLRALCEKHLTKEMRAARPQSPPPDTAPKVTPQLSPNKSNKTARAYAKSYRLGPPLVPAIVVDRITDYVSKFSLRKKPPFLLSVCKYWSLKREARRGAPLLKRLHLEPWTASSTSKEQTDEEKQKRLQHLTRLRADLERVRMLAELARKREKEKLKQAQILASVVDEFIFPHRAALRKAFKDITTRDHLGYFTQPVSRELAPDYDTIVEKPMHWLKIDEKLRGDEYLYLEDFKEDVNLVLDNSIRYNAPDTPYHKTALRIKALAAPILAQLPHSIIPPPLGGDTSYGDLESPLDILQLLLSSDSVNTARGSNLLIDSIPLESLFAQELEKRRPPSPSPPPPPDRKEMERERRKQRDAERAAKRAEIEAAPGLRARTRGAKAAEAVSGPPSVADVMEGGSGNMDVPAPSVIDAEEKEIARALLAFRDAPAPAPARTRSARAAVGVLEAEVNILPWTEAMEKDNTNIAADDEVGDKTRDEAEDKVSVSEETYTQKRERLNEVRRKKRKLEGEDRNRDIPVMSEDASEQERFKYFHQGFILPEGSSRRRAVPATPPPPLRVRARAGRESKKSRLSVTSSAPSENMTIQPIPQSSGELDETLTWASTPGAGPSRATPSNDPLPPVVEEGEDVVMQVFVATPLIPTPIIEPDVDPQPLIPQPPVPSVNTLPEQDPDSSDLSELSDVEEEKLARPVALGLKQKATQSAPPPSGELDDVAPVENVPTAELESKRDGGSQRSSSSKPRGRSRPKAAVGRANTRTRSRKSREDGVALDPAGYLPGHTLVWAKAEGYPYWPAEVVEPDDVVEGHQVLNVYQNALATQEKKQPRCIVQYFDKKRSWGVPPPDRIKLLGEDKVMDQSLLKRTSFKTNNQAMECRRAYDDALAAMEIDGQEEAAEDKMEGSS